MALTVTKSDVAPDEKLAVSTKSRERDDFQKEMDEEVKGLVKGWLESEKITDGKVPEQGKAKIKETARPKARYHVAPDDKSAFKDVLRRAGTLHQVEIVFLYPEGQSREPVDPKTGKAAVTVTVGPKKPQKH
jgi:hypothetical protein